MKALRRAMRPHSSVEAEVAVRLALTTLSAAAECASSSTLFRAQRQPAATLWRRSAISQRQSRAHTLMTSAARPVAWTKNSDDMAIRRTTKASLGGVAAGDPWRSNVGAGLIHIDTRAPRSA